MNGWSRKAVACILLVCVLLMGISPSAMALDRRADITRGEMAVDFGLVRPLGIAAAVLGSVVFVTSLPFSLSGGNAGEVAHKFVVEPAKFAFNRPLGEF